MNRSRFKVEVKKAKFETPFFIFNLTFAMEVAKDNELEIHVRCALLYDFKAGHWTGLPHDLGKKFADYSLTFADFR